MNVMEIRGLLPIIIAAIMAFVVLRMVLSAIKTSAKLMMWGVVAVITLGGGFLWFQNQQGARHPELPTLSIPSRQPAPAADPNC